MDFLHGLTFAESMGLNIIFQDPFLYKNKTCWQQTDNDIAGIGVVSAFIATATFTVILSVCAAILDGLSSPGGVLPNRVNVWLRRKVPRGLQEERDSWRKVLEQIMIVLSDQQLLTGITITVSGYVRARNTGVFDENWPYIVHLQENHFHLIVYLSCLSSSSHLASVVTLKSYFRTRYAPARIRLALVVIFALLLATSFVMSWPFGLSALADVISYGGVVYEGDKPTLGNGYRVLFWSLNGIAALLMLYPFWIAIINIFEDLRDRIQNKISSIWHTQSRWSPTYWIRSAAHLLRERRHRSQQKGPTRFKRLIWFLLLGSTRTAFFQQLFFFFVSLGYVLVQKTANSPYPDVFCDLTTSGPERWGFGQILPVLLLAQPILSAMTAYYDVFKPPKAPETSVSTHQLLPHHEVQEADEVEPGSTRSKERNKSRCNSE